MSTLTFQGKLAKKTEDQIVKENLAFCTFLVEQETVTKEGEKPRIESAAFELWNDKVSLLNDIKIGDEIKVSFNLRANEYENKFYNSLRAWKIEKA